MDDETDLPSENWLAVASTGIATTSHFSEDTFDLWRSEADGPMPELPRFFGQGIPDLGRIAEEQWRDALIPLSDPQRVRAAQRAPLDGRQVRALEMVFSMPKSDSHAVRDRLDGAPSFPVPTAGSRRSPRQVGFRITDEAHRDLRAAAELLGCTPGSLARILVLNGVRRVLAEQDVALDRARRMVS